jgi:hypothetical protein
MYVRPNVECPKQAKRLGGKKDFFLSFSTFSFGLVSAFVEVKPGPHKAMR